MSGSVVVNEIFTSIQGESTLAGRPCTFVRLTGCNLRCSYCDTTYAFHEGHSKEIGTIAEEVERRGVPFVTVTGGEPLLQEDVHALIRTLLDRGYEIQVESSGAVETGGLDPRARVILDIKTPGSGEAPKMKWSTVERLRPGDEAKFVLVDRADYEFARDMIQASRIPAGVTVLFSPAHGKMEPRDLAAWILEDRLVVRLQLQIHKYIWGSDAGGI
jgi:7-carboxy-7-deazaguanine synthase